MTRISTRQAKALGIIPGPKVPAKKKQKAKKKEPETAAQWDVRVIPGGIWIQIPRIPPSLNEWSRWHWAKRDRYLKKLVWDLEWLVKAFGLPRFEAATVQVVYYFRTSRGRDKDNYSGKFILDALRYAGVILDDRAELISLPEPEFRVDRERSRTEIFIWERREGDE